MSAQPHDVALRPVTLGLDPDRKLELLESWRSIKQRRWPILGLGAAAAVLAAVVSLALQPVYESTATVLIEAGKGKILSIDDMYSGAAGQQVREHYQTQVEIIKNRDVALRTVKALKLWIHPDFDPRKSEDGLLATIKTGIGIGEVQQPWTDERLAEATVEAFMKRVDVQPVRLSQLVKVSFESPDKKLAAHAANALALSYIESDRESKFNLSQQVSGYLQQRLASLRENLSKSEGALQDYREKAGIVSLGGSAQALAGQQLGGNNQKLIEARSTRAELESIYQQIQKSGGDYSKVPVVMRDPGVANMVVQVTEAKRKVAELSERMGSQNQTLKQAQAELNSLTASLNTQRRAVVEGVRRDYLAAKNTEEQLSKAVSTANTDVQKFNRQEFELSVLEREVASNRELYEMFMNRAKETNLAGEVQTAVARVVDPAVEATLPVKPKKAQIVLMAGLLTLLAGAAIALTLDKMDNTVKGGEDAELRLHAPLLTVLPIMPNLNSGSSARIFLEQPQSHYAEAVRTARTGILLSSIDAGHKLIMVTSSVPGEGKTTVSINLALAHSQTRKTLLIDADMRRPQIARRLGLPPGVKGLSNMVAGTAPLSECVHMIKGTPLYVMPVGDLPPNPLELLLSQRFRDLLHSLSEEFEMVLIDTPPVELVSDALSVAPQVTNAVYVVKAMSTPAPLVRKCLTRLQRAGGSVLGIVVNQLDFDKAQSYYGEYGAYTYGGYGYNPEVEDDSKKKPKRALAT